MQPLKHPVDPNLSNTLVRLVFSSSDVLHCVGTYATSVTHCIGLARRSVLMQSSSLRGTVHSSLFVLGPKSPSCRAHTPPDLQCPSHKLRTNTETMAMQDTQSLTVRVKRTAWYLEGAKPDLQ
jgi:hypothetical protein